MILPALFRSAYRAIYPLLARRANAVTTVSQFSRAILERFHVASPSPRAAFVIGNGHEHALGWTAAASRFDAIGTI